MRDFRRFGRFFGDYFDRERWWVMTPLWHVPYPPYPGEGDERQAVRIRVDWPELGRWLARVFVLGTMAFTVGVVAWLFW